MPPGMFGSLKVEILPEDWNESYGDFSRR